VLLRAASLQPASDVLPSGAPMRASGIVPTQIVARINFSEGRLAVIESGRCVCYSVDTVIRAFPQFRLRRLIDLPPRTRWLYIGDRVHADVAVSLRSLRDTVGSDNDYDQPFLK
jgi:hypothetical protein